MPTRQAVERTREFRRRLTPPAARLWFALKGKLGDLKFRRQHPIGPWFLDFFCPETRLAVEVDGQGQDHPNRSRATRRARHGCVSGASR